MENSNFFDDVVIIMANCETPEQGMKLLADYQSGKTSVSRMEAIEIIRKKMEEETAMDISKGDTTMAKITPDAFVDYFMSYSLLRFQCGMQKDAFKKMLESIASEVSKKYFG